MRGMQLVGIVTVVGVLVLTAVYVEVLGAPGFSGGPVRDAHSLTIEVFLPSDSAPGEAGSPCLPGAHHQLVVTDDAQRLISVVDLAGGAYERRANQPGCRTDVEISVRDSPYYTFSIEGAYRMTMARETLAAGDWSIAIAGS